MDEVMDILHRPQFLRAKTIRQGRSRFARIAGRAALSGVLFFLAGCTSGPVATNSGPTPPSVPTEVATEGSARRAELLPFDAPMLQEGTDLKLGGLSGLHFQGTNEAGEWLFLTLTDRGPNAEGFEREKRDFRPFAKPDFQPRFLRLALNRKTKVIRVASETLLSFPNGRLMTGLPNLEPSAHHGGDEIPTNLKGDTIAMDLMGIDPESICTDKQGSIWVGEEYRPSILKFSGDGKLLKRYVPMGAFTPAEIKKIDREYGIDLVMQVLPRDFNQRKKNRGFEGIACVKGKIFAILQSPLSIDKDQGKTTSIRMLEFDPEAEEVTRELIYMAESKKSDKIGDMAAHGDRLLVLEQGDEVGPNSFHRVYEVDPFQKEKDSALKKTLFVDLVKNGYDFAEKVEGISLVDEKTLAVINDNDFGLSDSMDLQKGELILDPKKKTVLGIIPVGAQSSP